jgi:hypothetical protein
MNAPTFLTLDEIADLTGWKVAKKQTEWLKDHGWQFDIDAKKRPKVLRIAMLARLGGLDAPLTEAQTPQPQMRFNHATKKKTARPATVHVPQARKVLSS